jgi:hypothetical protein
VSHINAQECVPETLECFKLKFGLNTQGKQVTHKIGPFRGEILLILVEYEMSLGMQIFNPNSGGVGIIWIKLNDLPINGLPDPANLICCEVMVPLILTKLGMHPLFLQSKSDQFVREM